MWEYFCLHGLCRQLRKQRTKQIPSSAPAPPPRDHPLSIHRCIHLPHSDRTSVTLILSSFLFPAKVSVVALFHSLPKHRCFRSRPRPWLMPDIFTDFKTLVKNILEGLIFLATSGDSYTYVKYPIDWTLCRNYSVSCTESRQSDSGRKSNPDTLTWCHFCAPCE